MPVVEFEGEIFNTDEDGFLYDFYSWNEAWVKYVKTAEGIEELTDDHRLAISILRDYYIEHRKAPRMSILTRETGFKLKYIYELFPSGPGKGACRMAGLPKPVSCV
ncbi:MAG: TusE/DsrC/DsvC family sulfur relay protein [Deltaproteobacteria bacterium]|nr:TusE/DsrC/DsvC family sulfur relay protein [Deltaproteobacteria bacterium]